MKWLDVGLFILTGPFVIFASNLQTVLKISYSMKRILQVLFFICVSHLLIAGEGMWLPHLLKQLNEKEMQEMGMKLSAEDIYSINKGSLKDAIVHFGGFCTSELISGEGLLLTNWHCGRGSIQSHTSLEHNYLKDGFWAKTHNDELPNTSLSATFIVRIEEVTDQVLAGIGDDISGSERQSMIDKNIDAAVKKVIKKDYEKASIRSFYKGNQYFLFVTMTYNDVRLVGTPPQSIGEFGKDTDNWVWPRHTGDFSLFRIYANADNLPTDYSVDNVPFKPKHFLPISLDGIEQGDFTMVFGFPGRTNEYLPAAAVRQVMNVLNPVKIGIRDATLAVWGKAMRADEKMKIQYTAKFSSLSNSWKRWQGEILGINRTRGFEKKEVLEKEFLAKVYSNPTWKLKYGNLLETFDKNYAQIEEYAIARDYYSEVTGRNVEIFRLIGVLNRLVNAYENNGKEGYARLFTRFETWLNNFYKNYQPVLDEEVFAIQMEKMARDLPLSFTAPIILEKSRKYGSFENWSRVLFSSTATINANLPESLSADPEETLAEIKADPAMELYNALRDFMNDNVNVRYNQINDENQNLQKKYMKALMEVFPERRFYPDANSTMRVTYGRVDGYKAKDAVYYGPITYLDGIMEKYKPGDYEFDVPDKLVQLYKDKDYGAYGDNGKMPICFIGTNHTTGGNSGSPAIDAHGNLVGLNFDRAWEGVMSDYNYDSSICRNIMVDIRYVLFVVDKYAGAERLINEMKLVHPKKG